jgi:hypothetical protein
VLVLALAAPAVLAAPSCDADGCTVEVTLEATGAMAVAQPDISAGTPLVIQVANLANRTVNVTLDETPLRITAGAFSNATSERFSLTHQGTYTLREDGGNGTATLAISAPMLQPPAAGDGDANLWAVLLPVLVGLALITLATIVVRHGAAQRHNKLFAALYFLSGLKSLSEGITPMADSFNASASLFPDSTAWALAGAVCALVMTPLLLIFVSSFPRPTEWIVKHPKRGVLAFVPSLLIALLLFTSPPASFARFAAAIGFSVFSTFVTAAALILLMKARAGSPDPVERKQAGYVIVGFLPSFIATWVITTLYVLVVYEAVDTATAQWLLDSVVGILSPVFELVAASLVGFAILKYQLLGVNPRFRLGVKSALAGAMFIGVFLATQFIENVLLEGKVFAFAGNYGFLLSGATGIVLFKPIEKVSGRVSDKLLPGAAAVAAAASAGDPGAKPAQQESSAATLHAEQIYHAQCTYVLRDAHVTDREMALLRNLRSQLGLSDEQARRIEQGVERLLKVDAPQTGHGPAEPGASSEAAQPPNMAPPGAEPPAAASAPAEPGDPK